MRAGKLDRSILILRSTVTIDDAGTLTPTWTLFATLRAQMVQQSTDEFIRSQGGATSANAIVFQTRYINDVRLDDRVNYDETEFDIVEIKEIGRRRGLEIRCVARGS